MNTRVLFLWFPDGASSVEAKQWHWLPSVPAVGSTVHLPLDDDPYSMPGPSAEDSIALEVIRVAWTCDGGPFWHAEVRLR